MEFLLWGFSVGNMEYGFSSIGPWDFGEEVGPFFLGLLNLLLQPLHYGLLGYLYLPVVLYSVNG